MGIIGSGGGVSLALTDMDSVRRLTTWKNENVQLSQLGTDLQHCKPINSAKMTKMTLANSALLAFTGMELLGMVSARKVSESSQTSRLRQPQPPSDQNL